MSVPSLSISGAYFLPTLSVINAKAAIAFYQKAFGATVLKSVEDPDGNVVAEMKIGNAGFIVAEECPEQGNYSPKNLTGIAVRLGLMVADPDAVAEEAVRAGATVVYPVEDQHYGYRLGHFIDPFGHHWEIGKPLK